MLSYILLLLSFLGKSLASSSTSSSTSTSTCGSSPHNTFYINNNIQLNNLNGCGVVNGSIFINGGYNIESLEALSQLNHITGNLVIIDSHILDSLKGIHNIQKIDGDSLYLNQYSVVIKDNVNNHDDEYFGLCFSNSINWTKITDKDVLIKDNNETCSCYSECLGCFGPGPRLCQECKNFISGDACVSHCLLGSSIGTTPLCIENIPSRPNLQVLSKTSNSITLNLVAPTHPGGFINQYNLFMDGESVYQQIYQDDGYHSSQYSYSYTIDNLKPYTNYSFDLEVFNNIGHNNLSSPFLVETLPGPPSKPENVFIDQINSRQVNLNWQEPLDKNGVIVNYEYYLEGAGQLNKVNITNDNINSYSYIITGLNPYTSYSVRIRAYTTYHLGNFSDIVSFTTQEDLPSTPSNLEVKNITHESAQLSWDVPVPANGIITNYQYNVFEQKSSGNILVLNSNTNNNFVSINSLSPFTDYEFEVVAFTSVGMGNFTDKFSFKTGEWIPSKPRNIQFTNITSNGLEVSFTSPEITNGNIINYNFKINYNKNDGTSYYSGYLSDTYFNLDNLDSYTKYNVSINACNQLFCSDFTDNLEFITDESIPESPLNLNYNLIGSIDVDLQWDAPNKPNGIITSYEYNLYGNRICNNSNDNRMGTSTINSVTLNNLFPYSNYNLNIKACNSKGCSINSNTLSFITGNQKPDKMLITNLDSTSNTTLNLVFNDNEINCYGEITSYEVETTDSNNNKNQYTYSPSIVGNSITISNLMPFMDYQVRLRGTTSQGHGQYSDYHNIKMPAGIPPKPQPPFIFNNTITNNSLTTTIEQMPDTTGIINSYKLFLYNNSGVYLVYEGNFKSTHIINDLKDNIDYWLRVEVCNTANLCVWSDKSAVVKTTDNTENNKPGNNDASGNNNELSDEAKFWIIGATLGLLFLIILVLIIVKLVKNHKEKKRALASAIRPVTPSAQRNTNRSAETAFRNEAYRDLPVPRNMLLETNEKYQKKETDYVSELDETSSTESFGALNKPITNNNSKITKVIPIGVATSAINENDMELESIYDD